MSEHSPATVESTTAVLSTPDFNSAEQKFFGEEDTHATSAISRMLVLFFLYSLLIMGSVVYVLKSKWMDAQPNAAHDTHEATAPF